MPEHAGRERRAVKFAADDHAGKGRFDGAEGLRLAGDRPGLLVGVQHRESARPQQAGQGAFARANRAGQANTPHGTGLSALSWNHPRSLAGEANDGRAGAAHDEARSTGLVRHVARAWNRQKYSRVSEMAEPSDEPLKDKAFMSGRTALGNEVLVSLARFMTAYTAEMSALTAAQGLSLVHHNVLSILRGAGPQGLPCGTVATRLITREPDVTRLLDRMEKQGLVVRRRDQTDRRVVLAGITAHGLEVLARLDPPLAALLERTLGQLPNQQLSELLALSEQLRTALR